jgi:hypothetical protein
MFRRREIAEDLELLAENHRNPVARLHVEIPVSPC